MGWGSIGTAGLAATLAVIVAGGVLAHALSATPTPPLGTPTPVVGETPTAPPGPTQLPPPTPTATPTPLPPACWGKGSPSPLAPTPPTNLRAELESLTDVLEGFVVRLEWEDNADDEVCEVIERKVGADDWSFLQGTTPGDPSSRGPVFLHDIPQQVGIHCYRLYYGNEAGRSAYTNEACVDVEIVPKMMPEPPTPPWVTSTPTATPTPSPWVTPTPLLPLPALGGAGPGSPTAGSVTLWALIVTGGALLLAAGVAAAARRGSRP
jgi:hypothetical protein